MKTDRSKRKTHTIKHHETQRRCPADEREHTSKTKCTIHTRTHKRTETHGYTQANAHTHTNTFTRTPTLAQARASCFVGDGFMMPIRFLSNCAVAQRTRHPLPEPGNADSIDAGVNLFLLALAAAFHGQTVERSSAIQLASEATPV